MRAAITAIFLLACLSSLNAQEQTGTIVFYREAHALTGDFKPTLYCDSEELARIENGSSFEVTAPVGTHTCTVESLQRPGAIEVNVADGKHAYVHVKLVQGWGNHAALANTTESEYTKEAARLKPLKGTAQPPESPESGEAPSTPDTAPPQASSKHSGNFGDLAVTVTSMDSKAATSPDRREVTVFLAVNNTGNGAICASLSAKMETTFALEYSGISGKAPKIRELLPGESTQGSYDFDVKNGVQPLELVLELQEPTLSCSAIAALRGSIPSEVRLDVHDLPQSQTTRTSVVTSPTCLYCPQPAYPSDARQAGFQGTVTLQAVIQADGRPRNIEVIKGSGYSDLDNKAIEAVSNWRFKPAVDASGAPVATITPIQVTFRLLLLQ